VNKDYHNAAYLVDQEQCALTISEVVVDWQEPVELQPKCGLSAARANGHWTRGSS